jgi:hypothetical protein
MPLPHFQNVKGSGFPGTPGSLPSEVVYLNLFEITFILPTILVEQGRDPILLLQNATKVNLGGANLTAFDVGQATQRFKYSTREFLTTPTKTSGEISIPFQVNVNQAGSMETWTTLKAWYDLVFNSQNGYTHYKADIIGTIIVNQHDKKGVVIRRVTFNSVQLKSLTGWDLDWASNSIVQEVTGAFIYDYFIDEYIDAGFTVADPTSIPDYNP